MEIADVLTQDDIPIKLRCAICNRLVTNAFRLPCCDQSICEQCQTSLPESCPVCAHTPLTADDCKPNKALRLTVKAFLKSEEKKRDKDRVDVTPNQPKPLPAPSNRVTPALAPSAQLDAAQAASVDEDAVKEDSAVTLAQPDSSYGQRSTDVTNPLEQAESQGNGDLVKAQDIPQPSVESTDERPDALFTKHSSSTLPAQEQSTTTPVATENPQEAVQQNAELKGSDSIVPTEERTWDNGMGYGYNQMHGNGFDFNSGIDGFGNANWSSGVAFSPMMQMQSGMPNAAWGGYPNMMGIATMGIDPMGMSTGMFGGYGMNGMGMNGMNGMSLGVNYDGGYGMWGPQSAIGMHGTFGANAGYYPGGGYNHHQAHQGQFNQMHHQQQYPNVNYQNRFSGRSFSHGRGHSHAQRTQRVNGVQNQEQHLQVPVHKEDEAPQTLQSAHEAAFHHQLPIPLQDSVQATEEKKQVLSRDPHVTAEETETEFKEDGDLDQPDEAVADCNVDGVIAEGDTQGNPQVTSASQGNIRSGKDETSMSETKSETVPLPEVERDNTSHQAEQSPPDEPVKRSESTTERNIPKVMAPPTAPASAIPKGPAAAYAVAPFRNAVTYEIPSRGRASVRSFHRGISGTHNAHRGRGTALVIAGDLGHAPPSSPAATIKDFAHPSEPKGQGVMGAPKGPRAMREGLPNVGFRGRGGAVAQSRSVHIAATAVSTTASVPRSSSPAHRKSRSRSSSSSRSRTPSRWRRHRRHHRSRSASDTESHDERERRRERRKRRSRKYSDGENGEPGATNDVESTKSSLVGPPLKPNSSREEEKHRSSHSRRHRSREHRRHRHRSRSPLEDERVDRDRSEATGTSALTSASGNRSKTAPSHHRHSDRERNRSDKDHSSSTRTVQEVDQSHRSNGDGRGSEVQEFKIKDRSKQSKVRTDKERVADQNPQMDPHQIEREARNRERLIKEQQRRESLNHQQERKRSRTTIELEERANGGVNGAADPGSVRNPGGELGHKTNKGMGKRGEADGSGRKARRIIYKYEDDERDDARAARVEKEREGVRWV